MSDERETPTPGREPEKRERRPRTVHKQRSVLLYILLLFLAACALILLSYLMQQRNNAQMLDGLNQSVSAMQSISTLQEDNLRLTEENAALTDQVEELQDQAAQLTEERDALARAGSDSPLLGPAREVAGSDLILVGAPYWDLSFPAALKVCLEWASCLGITFRYTGGGAQVGGSRARALVYVTTGGGPVRAQNLGYQYIQGWAAMMGVGETFCLAAENLDVWGTDVEAALTRAEGEIPALVRRAAGI